MFRRIVGCVIVVVAVLAGSTSAAAESGPPITAPLSVRAKSAEISPGGRWLAYTTATQLVRRDLFTGMETSLPLTSYAFGSLSGFLGVSPDVIFVSKSGDVYRWSITTVELVAALGRRISAIPSKLGRYVAYSSEYWSGGGCGSPALTIGVIDTESGLVTQIAECSYNGIWSFDGRIIAYQGGQIDVVTGQVVERKLPYPTAGSYAILATRIQGYDQAIASLIPQNTYNSYSNFEGIWNPNTNEVRRLPDTYGSVIWDGASGWIALGRRSGDNNVQGDYFAVDTRTGAETGVLARGGYNTRLSADGRYVVDIRDNGDISIIRLPFPLTEGSRSAIVSGSIPAGASAALVNLAMVDGLAPGFITADRCSVLQAGAQTKSNGNFGISTAISNLSVIPVDGDGSFCVYNFAPVQLVADVQGYFASPASGGQKLTAVPQNRVLDTRSAPGGRLAAGSITRVDTGVSGGASSVLVNMVMVNGLTPGFITADRCSVLQAGPQTKSNGNFDISTAISNLSVVPVDSDGSFCIYNATPVNLVVDLQGSFTPGQGLGFLTAPQQRITDTRTAPGGRLAAGSITRVDTGVSGGASSVLVNMVMVNGLTPGFITADRCSVLQAGPQTKSNGNFDISTAISNLSVVPVDSDGSFCIYNATPVNLVVDLQGSFTPDGPQEFFPVTPTRSLDSRTR